MSEVTNMDVYHKTNFECSKLITKAYSTSFSLGIHALSKKFHDPIYAIYGYVRFADEIVDTFHGHDKEWLLNDFEKQTYHAIRVGISTNPVIHAFQSVVNHYDIDHQLINAFLHSMRMDLIKSQHGQQSYDDYIYGSAEVVGLMCLSVFCEGDLSIYKHLEPYARSLGAAFQKVNFLRDLKNDFEDLGRVYFPNVDFTNFTHEDKCSIELEIESDFNNALVGIRQLPEGARFGVYLAYIYYRKLFQKIRSTPPAEVTTKRIRINNMRKAYLLFTSYYQNKLNII